jgi:hypothetical protein
MASSTTGAWLGNVRRLRNLWSAYLDSEHHPSLLGATDADIDVLTREGRARNLHVDVDFVAFLRIMNRANYDSLTVYGVNVADGGDSIDFVRENEGDHPWSDDPNITLYGLSDPDYYMFNAGTRRYEVVDNGGGGVMQRFSTFGELIDYAIAQPLERAEAAK